MRSQPGYRIFLGILLTIVLAGCGVFNRTEPTPVPTDTPIPTPTLTPTPEVPLAILVLPSTLEKDQSDLYQKVVYELAQQAGYRFQVRNALTTADLEPALKIVIALPPDPGLADLAAAAPQTQFLAVDIPDISAGGNLSVIGSDIRPDIPAFLAGYIGALITDDYHIGMIVPQGDADAQKALTAYTNGMIYYCGLCQPFYFLPFNFPQYVEIPAGEDPSTYGAYIDYLMLQRNVETIYVYPALATQDMLTALSTHGAQFVSTTAPENQLSGLIAAVQPDLVNAIQTAWPDLIAGNGGQTIQSPPTLTDVDPSLLSPGKQRLAEEVLSGLLDGTIDSGAQ